ncbi:MAG TPA: hypothetical protein VE818_14110 [Nitrososphaeraceae archaeon]|jgi:hypothetical protein|nr:hypothetical protein [Nitrososphaeraceae archaeon]
MDRENPSYVQIRSYTEEEKLRELIERAQSDHLCSTSFSTRLQYTSLWKKEIVSSVPVSMERLNMISTSYFIYNFSFLSIAD